MYGYYKKHTPETLPDPNFLVEPEICEDKEALVLTVMMALDRTELLSLGIHDLLEPHYSLKFDFGEKIDGFIEEAACSVQHTFRETWCRLE